MKLFYREKGDTNLPVMVILHGLWGASDNWLPVADILSEHFHVILPDLRNHGFSPHSDMMDYPSMAQDILQLLRHLDCAGKFFMAGHSMGGKCLMYMLLHYPEWIAKAVVIDIAPKSYCHSVSLDWHESLMKYMLDFRFSSHEKRILLHERIRQEINDVATCQVLYKNLLKDGDSYSWKVNVGALQQNMRQLMDWKFTSLKSEVPVLFVRGALSEYLQETDVKLIRTLFTKAQFQTIPESGHWIHAQKPLELSEIMSSYFMH